MLAVDATRACIAYTPCSGGATPRWHFLFAVLRPLISPGAGRFWVRVDDEANVGPIPNPEDGPELDDDGNELPVKVVELNDEELAARCIARTRRPFLMNELQLWDEGVATTSRHLYTIDGAVRECRGSFVSAWSRAGDVGPRRPRSVTRSRK